MQKFTLLCNNLQYKIEQSNKNLFYLQKIPVVVRKGSYPLQNFV